MPLNCESDAPLVVKNVDAVPSGPTKLNGPATLLLPATWNFTLVFAGVVAVHESVFQFGAAPSAGLVSFTVEISVPDVWKIALFMYAAKTRSLFEFVPVGFAHDAAVQVTRRPPAMMSPLVEIHACVPVVRFETSFTTNPYCVLAMSVGGVAKTNVFVADVPPEKPASEAVARRPPAVMTGNPALVVRTSSVRLGFAPEQLAQNIEVSTFVSIAVTAGVNV